MAKIVAISNDRSVVLDSDLRVGEAVREILALVIVKPEAPRKGKVVSIYPPNAPAA